MSRFCLADVLDVLFYTVSVSFLSFGILRYYRLELWLCVMFSLLFAVMTCAVCAVLLGGRRQKKVRSRREKEARDALLLHLALEKEERVRADLLAALTADGKDAICEEDVLSSEGVLLIPIFTMEPLSADMVASLLRKYGEAPFKIVCNSLTAEAEKLLLTFQKGAIKGDEVYALFARTKMPNPLICGQLPRRTLRGRLRISFSKRNARPFFVSGLLLLFMSLFTLFPLYYLVTGSVLLVSAVLVRAVGFSES